MSPCPWRAFPTVWLYRPHLQSARPAVRHATDTPGDAAVLLFVGSLSVEKRPDRFLRVVAQVARRCPHLHAWLVGAGPLREALEQQAATLGLAERVHFLGVQADVFSLMAAADLLLLTSDTEGVPAVVLEAGAMGLPVVAGRVGGVPEAVRHGETGLLVDPQDEAGFVVAVQALLAAPERRAAMGRRARDWVVKEFNMEKIALQYLEFYRQIWTV
ncbi:MAG: hypothetical protein KatS3mg050_0955 [Litorilinea sp.]|nr:MAG: hypothetical protein KatS3mg050_0955 [Litorilinea sp.]